MSWTNNGRWALWIYHHGLDGVSHPRAVVPKPGKVNGTPGRKASKPAHIKLHWNLKAKRCLERWRGRNTGPLKCRSAPCRGEALGSSAMLWRSSEAPRTGSSRSSVRWTWTCWCVTSGDYRTTGMCYWKWTGHLSAGWRTETHTRWSATFGSRFELKPSNQVNWENFVFVGAKSECCQTVPLPGELSVWLTAHLHRRGLHLKGQFTPKYMVFICSLDTSLFKVIYYLYSFRETRNFISWAVYRFIFVCAECSRCSIPHNESGWGLGLI